MKNFPIKIQEDLIVEGENVKGKTFWVSRAVCAAAFLFCYYNNDWYVLATKRGQGCPNYQGYWCCPCGYIDYNETVKQGVEREVYEETGLKAGENIRIAWMEPTINDSPDSDDNQNITFRYAGTVSIPVASRATLPEIASTYSEENEVSEVKWISVGEIGNYKWAFNHKKLILETFKKI